jgi:hypothetical protein
VVSPPGRVIPLEPAVAAEGGLAFVLEDGANVPGLPRMLIVCRDWLRATPTVVQFFHEHKLVATQGRTYRPGQRVTNPAHPPPEKLRYLMQTPTWCRECAAPDRTADRRNVIRTNGVPLVATPTKLDQVSVLRLPTGEGGVAHEGLPLS